MLTRCPTCGAHRRPIPPPPPAQGVGYIEALSRLKAGAKMRRASWGEAWVDWRAGSLWFHRAGYFTPWTPVARERDATDWVELTGPSA